MRIESNREYSKQFDFNELKEIKEIKFDRNKRKSECIPENSIEVNHFKPRSYSDDFVDKGSSIIFIILLGDINYIDPKTNQNIVSALFDFKSNLIKYLYDVLSQEDKQKYVHILLKISIERDLFFPLLSYCLDDSIKELKDYHTFLRSDSLFHKIWTSFSRTVCKEYLKDCISPLVNDICNNVYIIIYIE